MRSNIIPNIMTVVIIVTIVITKQPFNLKNTHSKPGTLFYGTLAY